MFHFMADGTVRKNKVCGREDLVIDRERGGGKGEGRVIMLCCPS